MSGEAKPPLFILGPQRSGTSVMLALARDVLGYAGAPEGWIWGSVKALEDHFAAVRQELSDVAPPEVAAFSIARLSTDALLDSYTATLIDLHAREWGDGPIADKTPGPMAIAAAPAVKRHLPTAKFVVMRRRGIENVQSQQRRFPDRPFDAACATWSDSMRAWLAVRDELGEAAVEVDQADLHRDANGVGKRLADFLGAPDAASLADFFQRRFTEKTKPGDYGEDIDLRNAGWDSDQMLQFTEICGGMMDAFGYSIAGQGATPSGLDLVAGATVERWIIAARNPWNVPVRRGGLELHPDRRVDPPVTLRMPAALTPGRYRFSGEVIVYDPRCQPLELAMSAPGAAQSDAWTLQIDGSCEGRRMWEIPIIEILEPSDVILRIALDPRAPNNENCAIRLNSALFVRR